MISWTNDGGKQNPASVNIKGPQGETGATGATGATGPAGPGVPAGGTAGQVLIKSSATDYATEWGAAALYFTSVACSATTGDFATISNAAITADMVVVSCVFANPSAITSNVTWTTAAGSLTLNGTCTTATTADIVLVSKSN